MAAGQSIARLWMDPALIVLKVAVCLTGGKRVIGTWAFVVFDHQKTLT